MSKRHKTRDNKNLLKLQLIKKENSKNNLEFKGQKLKPEFKNFQSNYILIIVITQTK